jgi:hypothetical protein
MSLKLNVLGLFIPDIIISQIFSTLLSFEDVMSADLTQQFVIKKNDCYISRVRWIGILYFSRG